MELNKIKSNGSWGKAADDLNQNFSKVDKAVEQVKNATTRNKGYFSTDAALKSAFNRASLGDIAYVGSTYPYQIWAWNGTEWENTHENGGQESVNLGDYYTKEDTDKKLSELGSEVDGLSKDVDNLKEETSNSYKLVDITDELSVGAYVFTGRKGNALSASELNDGSFRRIKVDVVSGDKFVLTGTGTGQNYTSGERITEDLTGSVKNGIYTYSSTNIGDATTVTHSYNGGWKCIKQPVKAGDTIKITGMGGGGARLYCLVDTENVIQAIAGSEEMQSGYNINVVKDGTLYCSFDKNNTYSLIWTYTGTANDTAGARLFCLTNSNGYIIDIADVDEKASNLELVIKESGILYINVLTSYDYSLLKYVKRLDAIEGNIDELDRRMSDTEQQLKELEETLIKTETKQENLTTSVISGYYTFSSLVIGESATATRNYGGGWRCIEQPVKANERYIITGTGGGGARLYCLVSSAGVIKAIAESDEVQSNFELVVDEDGILYCNFNNSNNYALVKEYTVTISTESVSSIWANGSYEFGGTCNLDYTAPDIDRYSLPSAGKIVNAVYAWYDGLVSAFPNYVFREDCDAVMATLGISKPSAISDLPMYMYKFIPPKSPNSSSFAAVDSDANRIKAFIITGAHPEYTAVWDCYNAMKLVCEKWKEDKNLEELRWNADIYIIPCYNLYGVNNTTRTNENGVDLNRNAPTKEWAVQGSLGDSTYSGTEAGSEYSTKVLIHYLGEIKPQIFIDHHNTNVGSGTSEGDGKNMIYTHCIYQLGIDISNVLITQMTRKWKMRFPETFPSVDSDNTMFGYTLFDHIKGSIGRYCAEQGCLGSTYESNFGILYKNGIYSTDNRQTNTSLVSTCATEGFINYLLRSLRAYSVFVGVNALELLR